MKKFIKIIPILSILFLNGCGHEHTYIEATCENPKICEECGETQGEALGHVWIEATCTTPKTCSVCGEIEGEALGHTWLEATCERPKTCKICNLTEGEKIDHKTEFGVCSLCEKFQGEELYYEIKDLVDKAFDISNTQYQLWQQNVKDIMNAGDSNMYHQIYVECVKLAETYKNRENYLQEAVDLCSDYSNLSVLKSHLSSLIKLTPTNISSDNPYTVLDYVGEVADCCELESDVTEDLAIIYLAIVEYKYN